LADLGSRASRRPSPRKLRAKRVLAKKSGEILLQNALDLFVGTVFVIAIFNLTD
jgi:hypothetical protein